LIFFLLLGIALRFTLPAWLPLWPDELASFQRAHLSILQLIHTLKGNQPLYETLLHFWIKGGEEDAYLRLFSILVGCLSLVIFLVFLRVLKLSLFPIILLSLSPLHFMFSRIARAYSLLFLFSLLSLLFLYLYFQKERAKYWTGFVIFSTLMVYTHFSAWLLIGAEGIIILIWLLKKKHFSPLLLSLPLVFLLSLPWLLYSLRGAAEISKAPYYSSQAGIIYKPVYLLFALLGGLTLNPFRIWTSLPLLFSGLFLFLYSLKRRKGEILFSLYSLYLAFWIPFLIGVFIPAVSPKHLIYLLIPLYILMGKGIEDLKKKKWRSLLLAIYFTPIMISFTNYFLKMDFTDASMVTPWREIAQEIERKEEKGECILVESDLHFLYGRRVDLFRRYYKGNLPVFPLSSTSPQEIEEKLKGFSRVWILLYAEGNPQEFLSWMKGKGEILYYKGFQWETHVLKGIREGWRNWDKYASFLYELILLRKYER